MLERIHELAEYLSAETFLWQVDFGGQTGDLMKQSLGLFIDEVLPHLP